MAGGGDDQEGLGLLNPANYRQTCKPTPSCSQTAASLRNRTRTSGAFSWGTFPIAGSHSALKQSKPSVYQTDPRRYMRDWPLTLHAKTSKSTLGENCFGNVPKKNTTPLSVIPRSCYSPRTVSSCQSYVAGERRFLPLFSLPLRGQRDPIHSCIYLSPSPAPAGSFHDSSLHLAR